MLRKLIPATEIKARPAPMTHAQFLWEHNQDAMAVEKLAEGIRQFAIDQGKLEALIIKLSEQQEKMAS